MKRIRLRENIYVLDPLTSIFFVYITHTFLSLPISPSIDMYVFVSRVMITLIILHEDLIVECARIRLFLQILNMKVVHVKDIYHVVN